MNIFENKIIYHELDLINSFDNCKDNTMPAGMKAGLRVPEYLRFTRDAPPPHILMPLEMQF